MTKHGQGTYSDQGTLQQWFRIFPGRDVQALAADYNHPRILLVEDDVDIARLVALHLADLESEVEHCDRGDVALRRALSEDWALIILDLRLPGMGGLDVCRRLREQGRHTPLLMLTAKSALTAVASESAVTLMPV